MDPIRVPDGLKELLREFTVAVLRSQPQPEDLTLFALEYFSHKIQSRHRGGGGEDHDQHLLLHHHLHQHEHPAAPSSCQPGLGGGVGVGGGTGGGGGTTGAHQGWAVNFVVQSASESDEDEDEEFMAPVINRFTRRASVCAETYDPDEEEDDDIETKVVHPKSDDQRQRLQEACKHILLFKNLERDQMAEVLDAMFEKSVVTGEYIIDMDDDGDNFYVIESGTYDILKREDNGEERVVGCYDNKGSFGELALMYNTPRAATIIATSPGALWCLDRGTFRRIILKTNAKKRRMYESFIESLPLLKSLEPSERMRVADVLVSKAFSDGERIIAQGDKPDCFYIVEAGQVRITMNRNKANEPVKEVEISVCTRGEYFGELALVTNKPRAASAYTVGNVKCLVMDVLAFERLLGPCMDIMKRNIMNYEEQLSRLFSNTDYKDAEQSPAL